MAPIYITADELEKLQEGTDRDYAIIDVRDEERELDGHIAGSLHFASGSFDEKLPMLLDEVKGKKRVIFHCALSQVRGPTCARILAGRLNAEGDPTEVAVLRQGFNGWGAAGKAICTCNETKCVRAR